MKRFINLSKKYLVFASLLAFIACSKVAVTGREQLNLVSDAEVLSMSYTQYNEFLKTSKISTDKKNTQLVKKVGNNISKAVNEYLAQEKLSDLVKDYNWEFNLVESEEVNAWCMPGGKVVFYTGILPYTKDEIGMAVVMGHEIAHAIAKHGQERMSQQLLQQVGAVAVAVAVKDESPEAQAAWMAAYGIGSQIGVMLPYSRLHESEADHLGLIFMAMAGYNPEAAIEFWTRMSESGGAKPPEILSTHPSDEKRIADLKKLLPKAMEYYKKGN